MFVVMLFTACSKHLNQHPENMQHYIHTVNGIRLMLFILRARFENCTGSDDVEENDNDDDDDEDDVPLD